MDTCRSSYFQQRLRDFPRCQNLFAHTSCHFSYMFTASSRVLILSIGPWKISEPLLFSAISAFFCVYILSFFSDIYCFIHRTSLVNPAAEDSSNRFQYDDLSANHSLYLFETFRSSSVSVTSSCGRNSRGIVKAMGTD